MALHKTHQQDQRGPAAATRGGHRPLCGQVQSHESGAQVKPEGAQKFDVCQWDWERQRGCACHTCEEGAKWHGVAAAAFLKSSKRLRTCEIWSRLGNIFIYFVYSFYHEVYGHADQTQKGIFLLCWTQNSVCFERSLGLKRCDEDFSSRFWEGKSSCSYACGPSLAITVPGCTFLAVPYTSGSSLGITALGTVPAVYSLSLCWRAHICYWTPDSILTLFLSSSYTQWGCYRRLLPWKHLVLRSWSPPGCLGIGWNHRRPALQIPGPSTDSCSHQPGPVILWSLRWHRDYDCFYLT